MQKITSPASPSPTFSVAFVALLFPLKLFYFISVINSLDSGGCVLFFSFREDCFRYSFIRFQCII